VVQEQQTNTSARDLIKQKYNVDEDACVGGETTRWFLDVGKSNKKSLRAVFINQNDNVDEDAW